MADNFILSDNYSLLNLRYAQSLLIVDPAEIQENDGVVLMEIRLSLLQYLIQVFEYPRVSYCSLIHKLLCVFRNQYYKLNRTLCGIANMALDIEYV